MIDPKYFADVGDNDPRLHAPAAQRNRDPILDVLREVLPQSGYVLEIASGSGEHVMHFAENLPHLQWMPSDSDPQALASIQAWHRHTQHANVLPASLIDVTTTDWQLPADAGELAGILAINLIHIAPWEVCEGLIEGSAQRLSNGGVLYLYGPFKRNGRHTAPSNQSFDEMLRRQNPAWGVRDLSIVTELAGQFGFTADRTVEMPANNLSVVLRRNEKAGC